MVIQNILAVLLPIYIFLCITTQVSAHSNAIFACNVDENPALANFTFCDQKKSVKERVKDLVSRLTLKEKVGFMIDETREVKRLGIPTYNWWNEILHGVSDFGPGVHFTDEVPGATSFPQVLVTAASFNATLYKMIGKVISTEARAMFNLGLAGLTYFSPNINIFRDPRWGRGQETPGEDPLLTSIYGKLHVQGLQERENGDKNGLKVAACCKHHAAYDLDNWEGNIRYGFNAIVTLQDMTDTFEPPFKTCVIDGKAASVMCSYNKLDGVPTCANKRLLKDLIRGKWKLNGYISSDCDSLERIYRIEHFTKTPQETAAKSLEAGVDLDCGRFYSNYTELAVKTGLVNESSVNEAVTNNFATLMRLGFFDGNPRKQFYGELGAKDVCTPAHRELARDAARQGFVLLKNTDNSLPLCPNSIKSLAVIGPNANATHLMLGNYEGKPCSYVSPLQGLSELVHTVYEPGCLNVSCSNPDLEKTTKAAATTDATVIVVGTDFSVEAEYLDRDNITLAGKQELLVKAVANASRGPVILVLMCGSGMDIKFAKNDPNIHSIIWIGYPGESGGAALADVIFGSYNPSGRLPITWYPNWYTQKVPMKNMKMRANVTDCYPGRTYRFYTGETVYKFGDGLSYTTFRYQLVDAPKSMKLPLKLGHPCRSSRCKSIDLNVDSCKSLSVDITLKVQNIGFKSGSHSVLLFTIPPAVHNAPLKSLVGFKKLHLAPKESGLVKFKVDICRHLKVIDEFGKKKLPLGLFLFDVGNLKHPFTLEI